MGSAGMIKLVAVFEMLDQCAAGHTIVESDHKFRITFQGRVFPSLPTGPHGKLGTKEIQAFHVRKLVRTLQIEACAREMLPKLFA